ncbi:MAG: DUF3108 domain-containing protein [Planctomycetota bacterium]
MRQNWPILIWLGIILLVVCSVALGEPVSNLLEKGIYAEETKGDLDEAIKIYRQIVQDTQANRRYVAQALYRMGMCYNKSGKKDEATKAFEKLIKEYADQKKLVSQARKHMPGKPFPEFVGCREKKKITLKLTKPKPGWKEAEPAKVFTIYQCTLLEVAWDIDRELAKKVVGYNVSMEPGYRTKNVQGRSVQLTDSAEGPPHPTDKAGEYPILVGAYDKKKEGFGVDEANVVAVVKAKLIVKPLPYTQIQINDIQPDGTIRFQGVSQNINDGIEERKTLGFVNSDFVHLTEMTDDRGEKLKFTTKHEGNIYRYNVTLGQPIPPGKAVIHSYKGTMTGLVKNTKEGKDEFVYHMKHWPANNVNTRRIETYRLPKGAELIKTTPENMSRRRIHGRTEVFVEKMIPPGGSITTSFRYRLAGAKLAKEKPFKLNPAPWTDGEVMRLRLNSVAGMEMGELAYIAEAVKSARKDAWRIVCYMPVTIRNMQQYTRVDAERDSFAPIMGRTDNSMTGHYRADYGPKKVKLKIETNERKDTREVALDKVAYDNEQALYLIRRLPLAEGYEAWFPIFTVQGGTVVECQIVVTGKEKVTVPLGSYDCYKMDLSIYSGGIEALKHQLWFSADKHQYLVKYDAGSAVMELVDVSRKAKGKPVQFKDKDHKISLTVPSDWYLYRDASKEPYKLSLSIIPPELKVWGTFIVGERDNVKNSSRKVAEADAETLKGFFKEYQVRPESWKDLKAADLPAACYVADYKEKKQDMVEYRTYILGSSAVYWFVFRVEKDKFDAMKTELDSIIKSFKVDG